MIKIFYYSGLFLLCFMLCFQFRDSYVYDPCGYVGTSNDPGITDFCLQTSTDCCYIKWTYIGETYYACVSKKKLIESGNNKNITIGFYSMVNDLYIKSNLTQTISSKCNSTEGVIITPEKLINSAAVSNNSTSLGSTGRRLIQTGMSEMNLEYHQDYELYEESIKDRLSYYLKYLVYKLLNLLFLA